MNSMQLSLIAEVMDMQASTCTLSLLKVSSSLWSWLTEVSASSVAAWLSFIAKQQIWPKVFETWSNMWLPSYCYYVAVHLKLKKLGNSNLYSYCWMEFQRKSTWSYSSNWSINRIVVVGCTQVQLQKPLRYCETISTIRQVDPAQQRHMVHAGKLYRLNNFLHNKCMRIIYFW